MSFFWEYNYSFENYKRIDNWHTFDYVHIMIFDWNNQKNEELKETRKISFEVIVFHINAGHILEILDHPNSEKYGNQKIYIIDVKSYAYVVPFVDEGNKRFLKIIFPSRKYTQKYFGGEK